MEEKKLQKSSENIRIREIRTDEYELLNDFLYEAIFIPEGVEAPDRKIIDLPELRLYVDDFGKHKADICVVLDVNRKVVGAAWSRIMNDYGHIDNETPSLSVSLYPEYRGKGFGTELFKNLLAKLKSDGYKKASLSVQKANYASKWYLKMGFQIVKENDDEYIMIYHL